MVIGLGCRLFDHVAGRGFRCTVDSALCPGFDGVYYSRCLELTRHQRPLLPHRLDLGMSWPNRRDRRRAPSLDVGAPMSCMNGWVFAAAHRSANGTKRTYRDDLLLVRFRATADIHARVASTASVVNDPKRT